MAHPPPGSLHAAARGMYPAWPLFNFQGSVKDKNLSLINLCIFEADSQENYKKFSGAKEFLNKHIEL